MADLAVPTTITSKAQLDDWVNSLSDDQLGKTQKDTLKSDIAQKLGLDMGNAITSLGRDQIAADVKFLVQNPNAIGIPQLDADLGGKKGPGQLDGLRAASNQFSDPFLIDLSAVLALMHETSEKLRSATKELREAENQNSQQQMQAAAQEIQSSGTFQAIAGGLGAAMSIASGAMGLKSAVGGMKSLAGLNDQVKLGVDDGALPPAPKLGEEVASLKALLKADQPKIDANLAKLAPAPKPGDEVGSLKATLKADQPTVEANLAKLDPKVKAELKEEVGELKDALKDLESALPKKITRDEFSAAMREIEMVSQKWQSMGTMVDGLGKALQSGVQSGSAGAESAKAIHDKEASQAQFETQSTNDLVKTLTDFSQQIRQTVQAILSSQDQAASRVANV